MSSHPIAPRQDVPALILVGAFIFGLGGLRFLEAQEPGAPAKGLGLASEHAPGQQAPPDPMSRLRAQQLATRKAKAAYEIARSTRELTEITEQEYVEFTFPRELASIEQEIRLAESDLAGAKDRLEKARFENRFFPQGGLREELTLKKAQFTLEQAQSKRKVLIDYTRPKTIREFGSKLERIRTFEQARRQAWWREMAREAELVRQLNLT